MSEYTDAAGAIEEILTVSLKSMGLDELAAFVPLLRDAADVADKYLTARQSGLADEVAAADVAAQAALKAKFPEPGDEP